MGEEKSNTKETRAYIPLHKRIQDSEKVGKKEWQLFKKKDEELNDIYRAVFETDEGQRLLSHLVSQYIGHIPMANATPNEIMFMHGQNYIVHDILKRIKRGEK